MSLSIKGAGKITEVTDAGLIASHCGINGLQSPQSTPTGTVGASCSPGSPTGKYDHGWIVEYKAEAKPGFTLVGWKNADDSSTYNPVLCDGANGSSSYLGTTATNCRFQIFQNLKAQAVFEDASAPSAPSISGPTTPVKDFANFSFGFISDPTVQQIQCRVQNKTTFVNCTSGFGVDVRSTNYPDGNYTLEAQTRDYSGNVSSISTKSFTVDKTAPETGLDPDVGPVGSSTTQDNDPTFAFGSNEDFGTFECSLTGPSWNGTLFPCTSPRTFLNLKDGTYTFKVRARDQAGNVDSTPATRSWTINNTPTVLMGSLTPLKGATGVSRTTNVSATFSEEMYPDSLRNPFTNVSKTFKLQQWIATKKIWKAVPATVSLSNGNQTALDPYGATETTEKPLAARKKFKATITTGAKDAAGNPLAKDFVWTFTTGGN